MINHILKFADDTKLFSQVLTYEEAEKLQKDLSTLNEWSTVIITRVSTGQGKVREFCAGSGKFEILRKVREIQENPLKVREI